MMKLCHGRKMCTVEAEEYVFGDPCPRGVNKYLNVIYTCGKENKKYRKIMVVIVFSMMYYHQHAVT